MANCIMCIKFDECPWRSDPDSLCSAYEQRAMTNADRIRAMSDEELGYFLQCIEEKISIDAGFLGITGWLTWLKQEAED